MDVDGNGDKEEIGLNRRLTLSEHMTVRLLATLDVVGILDELDAMRLGSVAGLVSCRSVRRVRCRSVRWVSLRVVVGWVR